MARPPKNGNENRSIDYRMPCTAEERARIKSDRKEAGFLSDADYGRHLFFNGQPLATGKGMSRPELRECLELSTAIQGKLKGLDTDADRDMQRLTEVIYKALRNDS